MTSCANCEQSFKCKPGNKGYYRYSLESTLPNTDTIAREHLGLLSSTDFTPKKKRLREFLCPSCWNALCDTRRYKDSLNSFFGGTSSTSYVAKKRKTIDSVQSPSTSFKRPRFTSTPLKVGFGFYLIAVCI